MMIMNYMWTICRNYCVTVIFILYKNILMNLQNELEKVTIILYNIVGGSREWKKS